jgi:hypothetical protein
MLAETDNPMFKRPLLAAVRLPLAPLVIALAACSKNTAAEGAQGADRKPRTVLVAQPCPALQAGTEALDPASARLFVEVAEVMTPGLPEPLGHWLDGRPVEARSIAHLVAFPDVAASTPWGLCVDAHCSAAQYSLEITARLPAHASEPIPLTLRIDELAANASPAQAGGERSAQGADDVGRKLLLDTTLQVKAQEPALLPPAPGVTRGALVITAYLLRAPLDLHRILECAAGQPSTLR